MAANSQFSMAVHVLTMLAKSGEDKLKSEFLACSVNTNAVVIRRLLGDLGHAKLVISQTGAAGGTRLARCPNEINLSEVYRAVSCGEVFALHAKSPSQDCPVGKNIEAVLCRLQKEIDRTVGEKLSQYTLADVMNMIEQGGTIDYGKDCEQGEFVEQGQVIEQGQV
jgi:Rrf2 family protein